MISLEFLVTSLIVVLIPGTGVIYTLSSGLFMGRRAALMATIGCTLGILPQLLASILGVAAIVHMGAQAFQLIKYLGVIYLLYLAYSMWHNTGALSLDSKGPKISGFQIALRAFLINCLNPKLSLFFLAFLPQFVPSSAQAPVINMLALGATFMLMTFVIFLIYGLLAHAASNYVVNSPRASKYLQRGFSLSFASLGAKLAFTEQ